jgi:hypothetical protein
MASQGKKHCKAISKSTGQRCKKGAVENGFCRMHLPVVRENIVEDAPPSQEEVDKNLALMGNLALNKQGTTKQKNRFIRIITVTTREKINKKRGNA